MLSPLLHLTRLLDLTAAETPGFSYSLEAGPGKLTVDLRSGTYAERVVLNLEDHYVYVETALRQSILRTLGLR